MSKALLTFALSICFPVAAQANKKTFLEAGGGVGAVGQLGVCDADLCEAPSAGGPTLRIGAAWGSGSAFRYGMRLGAMVTRETSRPAWGGTVTLAPYTGFDGETFSVEGGLGFAATWLRDEDVGGDGLVGDADKSPKTHLGLGVVLNFTPGLRLTNTLSLVLVGEAIFALDTLAVSVSPSLRWTL